MFTLTADSILLRVLATALVCCAGCQTGGDARTGPIGSTSLVASRALPSQRAAVVQIASYDQAADLPPSPAPPTGELRRIEPQGAVPAGESLVELEALAVANNPTLQRIQQEAAAAWAKARYVSKLPDPTVSSMFLLPPMNFDPDRQVAQVQVMQMIPWLGRLSAEERRAQFEAMAAQNQYQAERVRVLGDLRAAWYRLYVVSKQIEIAEADKTQLEALLNTANARVATGAAQPGDVLMASLELSSLQEQLFTFRQQARETAADLNRLAGRESGAPISPPATLDVSAPEWTHAELLSIAMSSQPELTSARLRSAAARWGIEVAQLKRRPDLTFSGGWMVMDAPGATAPNAGRDSWTLGVSASLPIWHSKYDAMVSEASREHFAAHAGEEEIALRLDATLRERLSEVQAARQTLQLYQNTILPQARQTFEADQKSLANNTVAFDRVIRDYRALLDLEMGYHRALGQLAIALARIQQAVGVDLDVRPDSTQGR
jgi:outer membrane protein TolC